MRWSSEGREPPGWIALLPYLTHNLAFHPANLGDYLGQPVEALPFVRRDKRWTKQKETQTGIWFRPCVGPTWELQSRVAAWRGFGSNYKAFPKQHLSGSHMHVWKCSSRDSWPKTFLVWKTQTLVYPLLCKVSKDLSINHKLHWNLTWWHPYNPYTSGGGGGQRVTWVPNLPGLWRSCLKNKHKHSLKQGHVGSPLLKHVGLAKEASSCCTLD